MTCDHKGSEVKIDEWSEEKTSWISMEMESCPASPLQGLGKNPAPFMALPLGLRT